MKIKGIKDSSIVEEIGPLVRRHKGGGWYVRIKLSPYQTKQSLGISQLPIVTRKRKINEPETEKSQSPKPAGYSSHLVVTDASRWQQRKISQCPITRVAKRQDKHQWCFVFEHKGITYYLPQLELARALFFQNEYLSRLALEPKGLETEFDILTPDENGQVTVNILPTSTVPKQVRENEEKRGVLSWLLFDPDARGSFDSIAQRQLEEGEDQKDWRVWDFRFRPPSLYRVKLKVRGDYNEQQKTLFVYDIYSVEKLRFEGPKDVVFVDPDFKPAEPGKGPRIEVSPRPAGDPEVNDDEDPSADSGERIVGAPAMTFAFLNPPRTTRIGSGSRSPSGIRVPSDKEEDRDKPGLEVSTNEATTQGTLPRGSYDTPMGESGDPHLYAHKFETLDAMVKRLEAIGCELKHREIIKLPNLPNFSKQWLENGTRRCLVFYLLAKKGQNYALLDLDLSDGAKAGSSVLLLKQPPGSFDWRAELPALGKQVVKSSLNWPTAYLKHKFPQTYQYLRHHKVAYDPDARLKFDLMLRWAESLYGKMQ